MDTPYVEILKNAFDFSKKNRRLWWFGLMASMAGGFNIANYTPRNDNADYESVISEFILAHKEIAIIAGLAIFALVIFLVVVSLIGRASLIKSVDLALLEKKVSFWEGVRIGRKDLFKIFLIGAATSLGAILVFFIIAIPVIFLFLNKSYALGTLMAILGILIFIPIAILLFYVKTFGYIYAVLGGLRPSSAMKQASEVFQKNIKKSIVMGLLLIGTDIIFMSALFLAILAVIIPAVFLGFVLHLALAETGVIISAVIGGIVVAVLLLAAYSFYETFVQTVWITFFRQIAGPKDPEPVVEKVEKPVVIPTPESIKTTDCEQK